MTPCLTRFGCAQGSRTAAPARTASAFTLVELAVVLGVGAALLLLLGTGLARTQPGSQTLRCLNNTRQLMLAWQMYVEDNSGRLPASFSDRPQPNAPSAWVSGWLDWSTGTDNTNTVYLINERYSQLARYLNQATDVFQCPADRYVSAAQSRLGWTRRARSYSANMNLGPSAYSGGPTSGVLAPYKNILKTSDFCYPGAGDNWVFVEEHPDSINDSGLFNPRPSWIDFPGVHHNGAGVFSMADGHAEAHRWTGSLTNLPLRVGTMLPTLGHPGDPDVHWVSWRAGRLSTTSY